MSQVAERTTANLVEKSLGRVDWSTWPSYDAATLGYRNFWHPVAWSRDIGKKPVATTLMGEKVMLIRDQGKVRAVHDRCPHRGVPLSHPMASQEFAGTWSCCYHGWTFDLETGVLVAAITDGPESPICGKVAVRTYPVEERAGLVWIFLGDGTPPPVETDVPGELLRDDASILGLSQITPGNWRFGSENGFDDGHAKYLHRKALWTGAVQMPTWHEMHMVRHGRWLTRVKDKAYFRTEFPGLGPWPPKSWWRVRPGNKSKVSIAMPGVVRVVYEKFTHLEWFVPVDADSHIHMQVDVTHGGFRRKLWFKLYYWLWVRWVFHGQFQDQDRIMVDVTDAPPERLYRPDVSLTEWRKLAEHENRDGAIWSDAAVEPFGFKPPADPATPAPPAPSSPSTPA